MKHQDLTQSILSGIFIMISANAIAAERNTDDQAFSSSVLILNSYDNNILSDQNEIIEANILLVAPEFVFSAESGTSSYEFIINGEIAKYDGRSEDNYEDASLSAAADYEFTSRHRISLLASYADRHDDRGNEFSQGLGEFLQEVDTFNQTDFSASYSFGRTATVGQIDFSIDSSDIDYDSRFFGGEDYTLGRDRSQITSSVQFLYTMTAKMALQANASHRATSYDLQTGLDSSENSLHLGLTWQGTSTISGSALVGYTDRTSDSGLSDLNTSTWQVDLTWMPLTYSSLNFTTSKNNEETIGLGNFRIVTQTGLSWNHQWKSRLSSSLSVQFEDTDFDGTDVNQDTTSFQASLDYQLSTWMNIQLSYTNTSRDTNSDLQLYNFDREIISISFVFVI
ncbi:MAG: hypothetical protein COA74_04930 [Gammaproteobacteria bacterium]|nr:MAG: hypothetical protein COA74_04930 [Gammaproteobacteria bacterium]